MGLIGYVFGELIIILGGLATILISGGYYIPNFKTEKDEEKHMERIRKNGRLFMIVGGILTICGFINLIRKFI